MKPWAERLVFFPSEILPGLRNVFKMKISWERTRSHSPSPIEAPAGVCKEEAMSEPYFTVTVNDASKTIYIPEDKPADAEPTVTKTQKGELTDATLIP
jgi:hypothetical protein